MNAANNAATRFPLRRLHRDKFKVRHKPLPMPPPGRPAAQGRLQNQGPSSALLPLHPSATATVQGTVQANPGAVVPTNPQAQVNLRTNSATQVNVGVTSSPFNDNRPDQWRYRSDNGRWWYWSPDNRWMWYNGSQWTYYEQPITPALRQRNQPRIGPTTAAMITVLATALAMDIRTTDATTIADTIQAIMAAVMAATTVATAMECR